MPSRYPLRVNIGFLLGQPIGQSREINFSFDHQRLFDPADVEHLDGLDVDHLAGTARFTRTPQGILLQARFSGHIMAQCVRCLADTVLPLVADFNELYAFDERTMDESGLLFPEDGDVDLAPPVREYLLLEVPIRPLCKPDCPGLCPECGTDWNLSTCDHQGAGS